MSQTNSEVEVEVIEIECYCCTKVTEHYVFEGDDMNYYECIECGCTTDDEEIKEKENE